MVIGTDSYLQTDLMPEKGSTFVQKQKNPTQNQNQKKNNQKKRKKTLEERGRINV